MSAGADILSTQVKCAPHANDGRSSMMISFLTSYAPTTTLAIRQNMSFSPLRRHQRLARTNSILSWCSANLWRKAESGTALTNRTRPCPPLVSGLEETTTCSSSSCRPSLARRHTSSTRRFSSGTTSMPSIPGPQLVQRTFRESLHVGQIRHYRGSREREVLFDQLFGIQNSQIRDGAMCDNKFRRSTFRGGRVNSSVAATTAAVNHGLSGGVPVNRNGEATRRLDGVEGGRLLLRRQKSPSMMRHGSRRQRRQDDIATGRAGRRRAPRGDEGYSEYARKVQAAAVAGDEISARVPVVSVHATRAIDVVAVLSKVFGRWAPVRHRFGRTSVVIQLPPSSPSVIHNDAGKQQPASMEYPGLGINDYAGSAIAGEDEAGFARGGAVDDSVRSTAVAAGYADDSSSSLARYVVVFRFGSVVFFNVSPREARRMLEEIKKHGVDPIPAGFEQREHFQLALRPGMEEDQYAEAAAATGNAHAQHHHADYVSVKTLDMNNVAVVSTIMGQTVALDSYNVTVDELLSNFASVNATVKKTGNFTSMERDALFRVVARNNSLFIDMVSELGLKDRSDDAAWNASRYDRVYQEMRDEFEIDDRFEHIEFKLNLIQENAKFFLEILHNQKSNSLEWIIIGLIGLECVIMCLDMSGMGSSLFGSLTVDVNPPAK